VQKVLHVDRFLITAFTPTGANGTVRSAGPRSSNTGHGTAVRKVLHVDRFLITAFTPTGVNGTVRSAGIARSQSPH
jgi:hypothetical protein